MEILTLQFWLSVASIIVLDLVLAGDNAVVIAMAARQLPARLQNKGIIIGAAGAILVRASLTLVAVKLLTIPLLQAIGALILIPIAIKLLLPQENSSTGVKKVASLGSAVRTIIIADVVMSLDNVLAVAGAAQGDPLLVIIGLLISIPLIIGGSKLIAHFMERFPLLIPLGAAILGHTSGVMLLHDGIVGPYLAAYIPYAAYAVPALTIAIVLLVPYALVHWFKGQR